jgi:hypothetical protein
MKMRRIHSANNSTDQEANMRGNASNADRRQTLTDRRQIELPYSGHNRRQYSWYDRRKIPWNDRRQNNLTGT